MNRRDILKYTLVLPAVVACEHTQNVYKHTQNHKRGPVDTDDRVYDEWYNDYYIDANGKVITDMDEYSKDEMHL